MSAAEVTPFERVSIQMEYVVPLVRDLQVILGEEVVNEALAERIRRRLAAATAPAAPEVDGTALEAGFAAFGRGDALDYEVRAADPERFDVDVSRCRYAERMAELGARDIGHLLVCNLDFPMAADLGLELVRTGTRMQGAPCCDFRFRKRSAGASD